jgi:hypothetical protein
MKKWGVGRKSIVYLDIYILNAYIFMNDRYFNKER